MMSALFLSKQTKHKPNFSDKLMNTMERVYQNALSKVLAYPKLILSVVIVLFISAMITLTFLGGEFIPALEEGDFALEARVLTGSNLNTTIENTQKAAHILKTQFPEVEKVVTKIGSGEVPTDPMPMEAADMMVILKDKSEWTSAKTFNELSEKMGKAVSEVPGLTTSFQYPVQMRFNELMTGAKQDVVCKIFGENLDTLSAYAEKLGKLISSVEGAKNLYVEAVTGMPEVLIEYNRDAIAQYNLSISDVNKVVNTAFAGQSTGLLFEGEKRFDIVVRLQSDRRNNLEDVKNLLIPTSNGTQIPLYQLAKVEIKNGPNQIQREDAKRRIIVGFNIRDRDVQTIVNELQQKEETQIKFPAGYYVTYGGAFENLNAAKQRLMIAVPVSLVLIFILLFFAFNSVKQGLLIYSAIPLSAIGGIFFLALRGMPFSISAGVGFIALFGVAVLNGIVLIAEFNRLKQEGMYDLERIVLMGTKVRLRPVLMTAFVASLGFLPMALSNGAGAEVQRPLATVVIGGLMIATFLTLFVLPILYILFEKKNNVTNKKTIVTMTILLVSLFVNQANAQTPIDLKSAMDTAFKNNVLVKNEKLKTAYQKKLIKTAASIPQTNVVGQYGQINSYFYDNSISVSQSFNFPTVYVNQKKLLTEEWKTSVLTSSLKEVDTRKMVRQVFYTFLYLKEKEKLLFKNDSIYAAFLSKANLRFTNGESNILEKTTAETQRGVIAIQLNQLEQDIELIKLQFMLLLNTTTHFIPTEASVKIDFNLTNDSNLVNQHPFLKIIEQQKKMSLLNTKLEKSKLMPDLSIGYYNMTMNGAGADNNYYNSSTRFQSVQVGLGIPLFFGSYKAKINASKINQHISENDYVIERNNLQLGYKSFIGQYQTNLETVNYFEKTALKNAKLIFETANKQFLNGELNYLEWVMLTNQAIGIQSNYLDAVKNLNETIIQINYLITK
jgi:cobalt-zinc-cadmium resistance protein CzcA